MTAAMKMLLPKFEAIKDEIYREVKAVHPDALCSELRLVLVPEQGFYFYISAGNANQADSYTIILSSIGSKIEILIEGPETIGERADIYDYPLSHLNEFITFLLSKMPFWW